jgi:hypothetical protein
MAIFHLKSQILSRSGGRGLIAAASYRSGEKIFDERSQQYYDFRKRTGILHTEIMAPLSAPDWVYDRHALWNTVDAVEKRKDAQLARELVVALPKELSHQDYIDLVRRYVVENFVKEGMIADFAIHAPSTKKGGLNYHAHIMLTQRRISAEGFGNKERQWNRIFFLYQWRKNWAEVTNRLLELEGFDCRIDHRSRATKEMELHAYEASMAEPMTAIEPMDDAKAIVAAFSETTGSADSMNNNDESLYSCPDKASEQHAMAMAQDIGSPELLDPQFHLNNYQEHRLTIKSLLDLKQMSLNERTEALEDFRQRFESQLERVNDLCRRLPDGSIRNWLTAFNRLEMTCFKWYRNQILADILEEKNAGRGSFEISYRRHLASVERLNYLNCMYDWHYHAVTDDRYFPLSEFAKKNVDQLKNRVQHDMDVLRSTALREHWSPEKLNSKIVQLKQSLDLLHKDLFNRLLKIARIPSDSRPFFEFLAA